MKWQFQSPNYSGHIGENFLQEIESTSVSIKDSEFGPVPFDSHHFNKNFTYAGLPPSEDSLRVESQFFVYQNQHLHARCSCLPTSSTTEFQLQRTARVDRG